MTALYNEIEPFAADWLEQLVARNLIAPGRVERRSIRELAPKDLDGVTQAHFFAGIGGWSYALRLAGWPDDLPVWTGSCPCQPFSVAGKRKGKDDERHLWPVWFGLIRECRPAVVFGEQVASPDGLDWLDSVSADLEDAGYAFAAADLCAAGVGAPHGRQRLYFVAHANGLEGRLQLRGGRSRPENAQARGRGEPRSVADSEGERRAERRNAQAKRGRRKIESTGPRAAHLVADASGQRARLEGSAEPGRDGSQERVSRKDGAPGGVLEGPHSDRTGVIRRAPSGSFPGAVRGPWEDAEWIYCIDGFWRPVGPGLFPLAHGVPNRLGTLRGSGNAIVPQVAACFVSAVMDVLEGETA